jgi:hypothetical protein
MADRYLLESGAPDGYQLEDGSGVLLLDNFSIVNNVGTSVTFLGGDLFRIIKTGAGGAWDADAVSTTQISGDFVLRAQAAQTNADLQVGVRTSDPTLSSNDSSLERAVHINSGAQIGYYENGVLQATPSVSYTTSDYIFLVRVGTTLTARKGSTIDPNAATTIWTFTSLSGDVYFDSSFWTNGAQADVSMAPPVAAAALTLTAAGATFTVSGQAANLARGYEFAADLGTYSYTGQAANLLRGFDLAAAGATFSYTGQAVVLTVPASIVASVGVFSYAGQTAGLPLGSTLTAAQGAFAYTGQAANFARGYNFTAAQATFSYTGQAAGLVRNYALAAANGTFSYSGQAAGLPRTLPSAGATFAYSGQAAALPIARTLLASAGSFSFAGQNAGLLHGYEIPAVVGVYSLTGQSANLSTGGQSTLVASGTTYAVSGQAGVVLAHGYAARILAGVFAVDGQPASLAVWRLWTEVEPATGDYVNDNPVSTTWSVTNPAAPGFSEQAAATGIWTEIPESMGTWS